MDSNWQILLPDGLYRRRMLLPYIKASVCGCIYTQLSDVEDESNGLYTYDRKVCKVEKKRMFALDGKLQEQVER